VNKKVLTVTKKILTVHKQVKKKKKIHSLDVRMIWLYVTKVTYNKKKSYFYRKSQMQARKNFILRKSETNR